eukprot:2763635-Pyramimonas_sp.AAC.1
MSVSAVGTVGREARGEVSVKCRRRAYSLGTRLKVKRVPEASSRCVVLYIGQSEEDALNFKRKQRVLRNTQMQ